MNKVKNYLAFSLCKITEDPSYAGSDGSFENYREVFEKVAKPSFEKNLLDLDEIIIFKDEAKTVHDVFKNAFFNIYNLWKSEKCNIIFCGTDTYCQHPVEVFNKFDKFMMFNYTSPSSYGVIENYFNCEVRYYPHDMPQETWDLETHALSFGMQSPSALELAKNWQDDWNYEQVIYNTMLWGQNISLEEAHKPELAWQAWGTPEWPNNNIEIKDAKIIHFSGSRQISKVLEIVDHLESLKLKG